MAESRPSISVAMCTYNGSAFIQEQLDSIAAQTRQPDELVICDDGSTDATPAIVAAFARSVSFPVRFFRNEENLGSTKNFEKAICLCTGTLIALSDQDDIWMLEKLARQSEMFEQDSALGGVFSDGELVDAQSRPIGRRLWVGFRFPRRQQKKFEEGDEVAVLLKRNVVTGATLMIRADLKPIFFPISACWHHDGWIAWMTVLYSKLRFIEEPLIRYRLHSSQQVGIGTFGKSRHLSLKQKIERGKREDARKTLSTAAELEELAQRLATSRDPKGLSIVPALHEKSKFLKHRGEPVKSRFLRTISILRNVRNYQRYDTGWRCLARELGKVLT